MLFFLKKKILKKRDKTNKKLTTFYGKIHTLIQKMNLKDFFLKTPTPGNNMCHQDAGK